MTFISEIVKMSRGSFGGVTGPILTRTAHPATLTSHRPARQCVYVHSRETDARRAGVAGQDVDVSIGIEEWCPHAGKEGVDTFVPTRSVA